MTPPWLKIRTFLASVEIGDLLQCRSIPGDDLATSLGSGDPRVQIAGEPGLEDGLGLSIVTRPPANSPTAIPRDRRRSRSPRRAPRRRPPRLHGALQTARPHTRDPRMREPRRERDDLPAPHLGQPSTRVRPGAVLPVEGRLAVARDIERRRTVEAHPVSMPRWPHQRRPRRTVRWRASRRTPIAVPPVPSLRTTR